MLTRADGVNLHYFTVQEITEFAAGCLAIPYAPTVKVSGLWNRRLRRGGRRPLAGAVGEPVPSRLGENYLYGFKARLPDCTGADKCGRSPRSRACATYEQHDLATPREDRS